MVNVLLAYDGQDEKSGDFFALCRNKSLQILQEKAAVVELDSTRNSLEVFAMEASKMNQQDFFFWLLSMVVKQNCEIKVNLLFLFIVTIICYLMLWFILFLVRQEWN